MANNICHQAIAGYLYSLTGSKDYVVAYSGGLDSSVLLHLMHKAARDDYQIRLAAVYINHGLSPNAQSWEEFCQSTCDKKGIDFQSLPVDIQHISGESIEAAARDARYQKLAEHLRDNQVLLTAHHQDDQSETLLLQLLRGGGLSGIAAMPELRIFSKGYIARPLLHYNRACIRQYAMDEDINWIEDDSNSNIELDRNYVRHHVLPIIQRRWPSASKTIARTAKNAAECIDLIKVQGEQDLAKTRLIGSNVISASLVMQLPPYRQRNLIRCWIQEYEKPMPSSKILERILTELIASDVDRNPLVKWGAVEVRRYRDCLYLIDTLPVVDNKASITLEQAYDGLPLGRLRCESTSGTGIDKDLLQNKTITIKFRSGGESIVPYKSSFSHKVKKIMSECGIPPWLRDLMPLIYVNNKLVAVPGICVDKDWIASSNENSVNFIWQLPQDMQDQKLPYTCLQ